MALFVFTDVVPRRNAGGLNTNARILVYNRLRAQHCQPLGTFRIRKKCSGLCGINCANPLFQPSLVYLVQVASICKYLRGCANDLCAYSRLENAAAREKISGFLTNFCSHGRVLSPNLRLTSTSTKQLSTSVATTEISEGANIEVAISKGSASGFYSCASASITPFQRNGCRSRMKSYRRT